MVNKSQKYTLSRDQSEQILKNEVKCIFFMKQIFFENRKNDEKIFLQTMVVNHKLWTKEDYWEFMVFNAVDCALDNLNEFGNEDAEELEEKKKSVIASTFVSYSHMMDSFCVDKEKIFSILQRGREKYGLSQSELPVEEIIMTFHC